MTYGTINGKTPLRRMMDEEKLLSKAAGCPPGHTYNKNIKKCLPGSPLSGISYPTTPDMGGNSGNSGKNPPKSADMAIKEEVMMRQSQGLDPNMQN